MKYPAIFAPAEEGGFVIAFPDVYEAITQGDDEAEGYEMAQDALLCPTIGPSGARFRV
jgi:antitoxin HicB